MPRGPKGERRPADVIGAAVMVAKTATGEIENSRDSKSESKKAAAGRPGGQKGGAARAAAMTGAERIAAAKKAAAARWKRKN